MRMDRRAWILSRDSDLPFLQLWFQHSVRLRSGFEHIGMTSVHACNQECAATLGFPPHCRRKKPGSAVGSSVFYAVDCRSLVLGTASLARRTATAGCDPWTPTSKEGFGAP